MRVDLGLEAAYFGMGQELVFNADVFQFELGGKQIGQALGQLEQRLVQGARLGAVDFQATAYGRPLAQGHDDGFAQGAVGQGAADAFLVAQKQGRAGFVGEPRGPGAPGFAGQMVVLASPDMGQDGAVAGDGHGGHAGFLADDGGGGLGRFRGQAAAQVGHGLAGDGQDAPGFGGILVFAQAALEPKRSGEDGRAHGVYDDHGRADDLDQLQGLVKGARQGQDQPHVDGLAHQPQGHGPAPVQGLARITPGDEPGRRAFQECRQGAGQGAESPDVNEIAVAAGDEPGSDADHRTAEKPGGDHAHGPQVGVGVEHGVAGVGAKNPENAKQHGDGGRGPGRAFLSQAHALEGGQGHDGEAAGQQQAEALG